jgi:hypothetical protein
VPSPTICRRSSGIQDAWGSSRRAGEFRACPPGGKRSLTGVPDLIPDAGPGWETILLLPVPTAEPAVGRHRARLVESAKNGVPAHITVLYPFLPPAGISEPLLASLGSLFAGFAAFEFTLDRVCWFGEEVVWLGPRDPAPFSALISAASTAFPSCPPYGGQHAEPLPPHLTIGKSGGQQALRAAAESVGPRLPIEATAAEVVLMTGPRPGTPDTPPGQWRTIAAFPLG